MRLLKKINIIKRRRNLWIPLVPAWSVEKEKKDEQERNFTSVYFCIAWVILANVKISHLPAFSSWLCDSFPSLCGPRATHEGNKSHNLSLQADNPYTSSSINFFHRSRSGMFFTDISYGLPIFSIHLDTSISECNETVFCMCCKSRQHNRVSFALTDNWVVSICHSWWSIECL